ncbi:MAG TPA: hypothetical protein VKF59_12645 [Candidatus Dormibacteraeota bacterium]|nr:hypothetical protein [Candidatus Dormibacteraeota bacterium]
MDEGRSRRALAWIGLAALAVAVAGVVYLRPTLGTPAASPSPAASPAAALLPVQAVFVDDLRGVVFGPSVRAGVVTGPLVLIATRDGGRTWRQLRGLSGLSSPGPGLLLAHGTPAAGADAVEVSADGGQSWRPLPIPALDVPSGRPRILRFAFATARAGWLLEATGDASGEVPAALWRTSDGGGSWSRLPTPDLTGLGGPADLRFVDSERGVLAVTGDGAALVLLATGDGGATWRPAAELDVPPPRPPVFAVELASAGPRVLAVVEGFGGVPPAGRPGPAQVYTAASADAGHTWTTLRAGPQTGVESRPGVQGVDRLLVLDGLRIWTSGDGGATWAVRPARLPDALEPIGAVSGGQRSLFVLAAELGPPGPLPIAARSLLRSSDDGAHWAPVALPRLRPAA